jgi:hypothetical protein
VRGETKLLYLFTSPTDWFDSLQLEVFNILFIREQEKRHVVHCLDCARKQSPNLDGFVCLEEYKIEELMEVFDNFVLHSQPIAMVRFCSMGSGVPICN